MELFWEHQTYRAWNDPIYSKLGWHFDGGVLFYVAKSDRLHAATVRKIERGCWEWEAYDGSWALAYGTCSTMREAKQAAIDVLGDTK